MTKTIDALVEALESCTTEEGPTQEELNRARAALALARAEQAEPVAWRAWFDADHGARWLFTLWPQEERLDVDWQPLYTAPPAAPVAKLEPLTTDEIEAIWVETGLDDCDPEGFARALEAALNAKLGGAG